MPSKATVGWLLVVVAGLLEVLWTWCMKRSDGMSRPGWIAVMMLVMCASFGLLTAAVSKKFGLPLGTAYAVWTGMGAAGAAALGMMLFNEPRELPRVLCLGLVILGTIGLKITHREPEEAASPPAAVADEGEKAR